VTGTGWFATVAAQAGPGKTVAVVGDGAVGLLGVLAAKQLGAERIIAMSRHEPRQKLALDFSATNIVTERGDEGVARIKDLTNGVGAHQRSRLVRAGQAAGVSGIGGRRASARVQEHRFTSGKS
jgi:threonine dehydrogenase-like Zn-dependent dehydrogenase